VSGIPILFRGRKRQPVTHHLVNGVVVENNDPDKPRYTYTDLRGVTITTDDRPPGFSRPPSVWSMRIAVSLAAIAAIGMFSLLGYVTVVYVIQGKPTARERQRQNVAELQREVAELKLRVDTLSLRIEGER
jgi:hypothetical protein